MLLTKTVKMKWNPNNREWYLSRGYSYTAWHDEFEVNVNDLSPTSLAELNIKCDYWNEPFTRQFVRYISRFINNNPTGKHSCYGCDPLREYENKITTTIETVKSNDYEVHYRVAVNDRDVIIKSCRTCGRYKELSCFRENNIALNMEYGSQCMECEQVFREVNRYKFKVRYVKETSVKMNLPVPMTDVELEEIFNMYESKCSLTGSINAECDHFIPVSWGHGGTYVGNIHLLNESLNTSKGNLNPFKWGNRSDIKRRINQKEWRELIKYLAAQNKLTVAEFEEYVNWCGENKRTAEEVNRDGDISSVDLWKMSRSKIN